NSVLQLRLKKLEFQALLIIAEKTHAYFLIRHVFSTLVRAPREQQTFFGLPSGMWCIPALGKPDNMNGIPVREPDCRITKLPAHSRIALSRETTELHGKVHCGSDAE